jgi:glycosyltransferase 2 family protein
MRWSKLLPLIGIAIFIYIIIKIGLYEILKTFTEVNYLILLTIPLFIIIAILQIEKWRIILKKQGIFIPYWKQVKIYLIGSFYGFITPARVGLLARSAYIKRYAKRSIAEATTSSVIEKILDLITVVSLAAIGSLFLVKESSKIFTSLVLTFVIIIIISFIILREKKIQKLYNFFQFFIPKRFRVKIKDFFDSFYTTMLKPKELLHPFIITILAWLGLYTSVFIVALSLDVNIPWLQFSTVYAISTVIGALPISLAGLGTREATLVILFSQFNIPARIIVSISLINMIIVSAIPSFIGWILVISDKHEVHNK